MWAEWKSCCCCFHVIFIDDLHWSEVPGCRNVSLGFFCTWALSMDLQELESGFRVCSQELNKFGVTVPPFEVG